MTHYLDVATQAARQAIRQAQLEQAARVTRQAERYVVERERAVHIARQAEREMQVPHANSTTQAKADALNERIWLGRGLVHGPQQRSRPPDPIGATTPEDLNAHLRDLRVWAGNPSYLRPPRLAPNPDSALGPDRAVPTYDPRPPPSRALPACGPGGMCLGMVRRLPTRRRLATS